MRLMGASSVWLTDEAAFRRIIDSAGATRKAYVAEIRDALRSHRSDHPNALAIWLASIRDSSVHLLVLGSS